MSISSNVVIMTRDELHAYRNEWFQKGVARGRFEERSDQSRAKATEGKAGNAEGTPLVRQTTTGMGLRVGAADAVQPATSEIMDVTAGETAPNSDPTPPDPVQGAEPSASKATATAASVEAGRTGGANPPTGATPPDREDGPPAGKIDWVDCPICGEPDMRKRTTPGGLSLIDCVNHACPSNGGVSTPPDREAVALEIWHRFAENSTIEWADETHKSEYLMCADAILALTSGRR